MTTVKSGTVGLASLGPKLSASSGLTLYGGARLDTNNNGHTLDNKILAVNGANGKAATYVGDLSAKNAKLHFIAPANINLTGALLHEGDSFTLSTGERLKFEDVDSNRLRFGGRLTYTVNDNIAPYIGAAWEHEFGGKARGTTNGYDINAPSLRGATGIGEVGLTWTPSATLPLAVDLGVQGFVGQREGVSGALQVRWEF